MTVESILKETRKNQGYSLLGLCKILDVSNQTILVWESGGQIPMRRIRSWLVDPKKPIWVRTMARKMIQARIDELKEAMKEPVGDHGQVLGKGTG